MSKQDKLIEQYLRGEISENDLSKFEKLLMNDASFAKEVAIQMKIRKAARQSGIAELEERRLRKVEKGAARTMKWKGGLFILIGILLVFMVTIYIGSDAKTEIEPEERIIESPEKEKNTEIPEELKNDQVDPKNQETPTGEQPQANSNPESTSEKTIVEVVLTKQEAAINLNTIYEEAQKTLSTAGNEDAWKTAILENNMTEARELLDELIRKEPASVFKVHYYYAGVLQLYTEGGDVDKAISFLIKSSNSRPESFQHLIIAYTKKGQLNNARKMLQTKPKWGDDLPISIKKKLSLFNE